MSMFGFATAPCLRMILLAGIACLTVSCGTSPSPDPAHLSLTPQVNDRVYWIVHAKEITGITFHDGVMQFNGNTGDYLAHGSATPITADGYYLTNAHVIKKRRPDTKLWLVDFNKGKPRYAPLEVVWQDTKGDTALTKSSMQSASYYRWSPSGELPAKTILIQTGYRAHMAHGVTLHKQTLDKEGENSVNILCTVKSQRGDSGAAFINEDGRLVALNSQWRIHGSRAVRPNKNIIEQQIRAHRKKAR